MSTTRHSLVKFLLVISVAATACSAPTVTEANTPLVTREISEDSAMLTPLISGTLVLEGGCVALEQGEGGDVMTVVWPDSMTVWNAQLQTVTMTRSNGDVFEAAIGDFVELGRGQTDRSPNYVVKPADDCPARLWVAS